MPIATGQQIELISQAHPTLYSDTVGVEYHGVIPTYDVSADGRFVAFTTMAMNVVPGQEGDPSQKVFIHDRLTGANTLICRAAGTVATAANGDCYSPVISGDGAYVAFVSYASNLVAGQVDTDQSSDVFLYERATNSITLVSHAPDAPLVGTGAAASMIVLSLDGDSLLFSSSSTNLVAGVTDTNQQPDLFLYERASNTLTLVSHAAGSANQTANHASFPASLSADGRHIGFSSEASNLVPGQIDTNAQRDAFLFDRHTGQTTLLSHLLNSPLTAAHGGRPLVSADGTYVTLSTRGSAVWLHHVPTGALTLVSRRSAPFNDRASGSPTGITPGGEYVLFESFEFPLVPGQVDTNGNNDVYLFERATGNVTLVSHAAGAPTTSADRFSWKSGFSDDGHHIVFRSTATNLVPGQSDVIGSDDIFLADRSTNSVALVSRTADSAVTTGNGRSLDPVMSRNGAYVAFATYATNLALDWLDRNGTPDLILHDVAAGNLSGLTRRDPGAPSLTPNSHSRAVGMSADGRFVLFLSSATNVVEAQVEQGAPISPEDLFLVDRQDGATTLVSHRAGNAAEAANETVEAGISADGNYVVFSSRAPDILPGQIDTNGVAGVDVFLLERPTGVLTLISHASGNPGTTANGRSWGIVMSADGRYIAFTSDATDLVPGQMDTNGASDVFLHDRATGTTILVSRSVLGPAAAGSSWSEAASISAAGEAIAFTSGAGDLVPGQVGEGGVFLFSRTTGEMTLVSHSASDVLATADGPTGSAVVSADGSHVAFTSAARDLVPLQEDSFGTWDVFLFSRSNGSVELVSRGAGSTNRAVATPDDFTSRPYLSSDGTRVVFNSLATDLVHGQQDTNAEADVFLFDAITGTMTLVSRSSSSPVTAATGASAASGLSADGVNVAFISDATDLITGLSDLSGRDLFIFAADSGSMVLGTRALDGTAAREVDSGSTPFTGDGNSVLFDSEASRLVAGDFNLRGDVFLFGPVRTLADLTVTVAATPEPVGSGGTLWYTIEVANLGPHRAHDISLTDTLPAGVVFVGAAGSGWDCDLVGNDVTCSRATIEPGPATEIIVEVRAPISAGAISNAVSVTSSYGDPDLGNNHAAVETTVDADLIFADSFESGAVTAWSAANLGGGDLTVTASAAMASTALGLEGVVNDAAPVFVEDHTPLDEDRYRARFYFDPSGFDPGEALGALRARLLLVLEENPTRRLLAVVLRRRAGQYAVMVKVRRDDDTHAETGFFDIAGSAHALELEWKRASAPGVSDGELRLWIDGTSVSTLTGLSTSRSSVDGARMGALGLKAGAVGVIRWDHFESRRSSYIGP